jgi:AcrR family transcriptional regulator
MPKIVDHQERRSTVVSLTEQVIREEGLAAVSFKGIADAAGSSTAIVSHYFENKQDLLEQTYRTVLGRSQDEQTELLSDPATSVLQLAERLLPLRDEMVGAWRISVEFFSGALADPAIRSEWEGNLDYSIGSFKALFDRMAEAGELPPHVDSSAAAQDMLALIRGIGTEFAVSDTRWPAERQRRAVQRLYESIVRG